MRGRVTVRQNDFGFGELSPEHAASGNKDAVSKSLAKARDVRILNSGGIAQRFGSRRLCELSVEVVPVTLVLKDGTEILGCLRANGIDFRDQTGQLLQAIEGAPWADIATVKETTTLARVGVLYVAHNDFPTKVYTYDDDSGLWSMADFAFADGNGGSLQQLYFRYAALGITMQPSALTGTIDVTFSDDVLTADHVGVIFRYSVQDGLGQEVRILSVVDPQHGTALVLNDLPPTVQVTVADSSGFQVGEAVKGLDTQATGFITHILGNDIKVAMIKGYESFDDHSVDSDHNGTLDSGEYLVGEFTRSYIAKDSLTTIAPAAIVAWDEAAISPVHGYPGDVFERSGRLGFADFPDIPDAIALSVPNAPTNFDTTGGDANAAIFERLGEEKGQRVKFCVPAANMLILTTKGAYYVPEGTDVPLSAENFAVVKISPAGCSDCKPAVVDEGVIYVESGGNRVIALLSTGSLTAPWKPVDVSSRASHLLSNPTSIAVTNGSTQAPERYVMVLNDDGTVAVLFFDLDPERLGWARWSSAGGAPYTAMTNIDGFLYTNCNRRLGSGQQHFLERFDATAQLDCSQVFTATGAPLVMPDLAGETVAVNNGTTYLGTFTVAGDGTIDGLPSQVGTVEAGFHFSVNVVLWPPEPDEDQRPSFALRHIGRVAIRVQDSQSFSFGIQSQNLPVTIPVYLPTDNQSQPPPLRSDVFRRSFSGWLNEPTVKILRDIPQPLTVLSVAQEVAF